VENYRAIDAWVTNMAMKEESFERLQDIIESAGELEKRVNFSDLVICDRADAIYKEIYL
jgi:NitT/TauT family transport system substrate-binding protein